MPRVTYRLQDGSESTVDVNEGLTVMEGAVGRNLPGILAECGGGCACATCHVHVDESWRHVFGAASEEEQELLELSDHYSEASRLSCQLVLDGTCDGLRVTIPAGNG